MILIVVDADDNQSQRQRELERALNKIRDNHLDFNEQPISDHSAGGLAIRNFETWLLADTQTVSKILSVELEQLENLEDLIDTKIVWRKQLQNQLISLNKVVTNVRFKSDGI